MSIRQIISWKYCTHVCANKRMRKGSNTVRRGLGGIKICGVKCGGYAQERFARPPAVWGRFSSSHQCTQLNVYLPDINDHTIAVSEPKILLTSIVSSQIFILIINVIMNIIITIIIITIIIRVIVIVISSTLRPHLPESWPSIRSKNLTSD